MSRYWPLPVRSRCSNANPIEAAPLSPAVTSPIAAPGGDGGPSASPFMSITPAYDAPRVSNPGLSAKRPLWPKPEIEHVMIRGLIRLTVS
jgi:hypothetical protein